MPSVSPPSHWLSFRPPEYLKVRSHDPEEAIRHDVIVSIVTAAKKDLSLVNDALLNFVKERTLDKRVSGSLRVFEWPWRRKAWAEYRSVLASKAVDHFVDVVCVVFNMMFLNFLSHCLPPCQWRVRKEAMMGLASIYKKYSLQGEGGREASKQISWIKDKLLHIYYQNSIDDRFVFLVAALKNAWKVEPPTWISIACLPPGAADVLIQRGLHC